MSLNANALVTLAEAKLFLGADVPSSDDSLVEALINAASSAIEASYSLKGIQGAVTEYHWGGRKRLFLRAYPAQSVTSITDVAGNTVPSTDYYLDPQEGSLIHFGTFPVAVNTSGQPVRWTIVYSGGRWSSVSAVDAAVKQGCCRIVANAYEQRSAGVSSVGVADLSVSYVAASDPGMWPPQVDLLLAPYKSNVVV